MTGALDCALDDLIGGKGKSGGRKGGKNGGKGKSRSDEKPRNEEKSGGKTDAAGKDKLDMALDDVISKASTKETKKSSSKGGWDGAWESDKGSKKGSWSTTGARAGFWDGEKGWEKGYKAKGKGKDTGKDSYGSWMGSWAGKGGQPWNEHDDRDGRTGSTESWGKGKGWGKWGGDADRWDMNGRSAMVSGRGSRGESPNWRRIEQKEDWGAPVGYGGQKRKRPDDSVAARGCKRIKVTNVPRGLASRDIKEAFEAEAGKTSSCELDRGVAYLTFLRTDDALKAVETFDRGELNGKTITVCLEP